MDAQLKAKWVEALRSGEYTQSRGEIGSGTHLCCIGVAGAVSGFDQTARWSTPEVSDRIGLSEKEIGELVKRNDGWKLSFSKIADYIEQNL